MSLPAQGLEGGHLWPLVKTLFNFFAYKCDVEEPMHMKEFQHHGHRAAVVQFRGPNQPFDTEVCPSAQILQIGGIGNNMECSINRANFMAKTQQDGIRFANVYTLDHNSFGDINSLIQAIVALYDIMKADCPDVPILGLGFSLGTGLIVEAATQRCFHGLTLQNAQEHPSNLFEYTTYATQVSAMLGHDLPTRENLKKIQTCHGRKTPLVIQTSDSDRVILPKHGKALQVSSSEMPHLHTLHVHSKGSHSQFLHQDLQLNLWTFFNEYLDL